MKIVPRPARKFIPLISKFVWHSLAFKLQFQAISASYKFLFRKLMIPNRKLHKNAFQFFSCCCEELWKKGPDNTTQITPTKLPGSALIIHLYCLPADLR